MDRRSLLRGAVAGAAAAGAGGLLAACSSGGDGAKGQGGEAGTNGEQIANENAAADGAGIAAASFNVIVGDVNSGQIMMFDRNKPFSNANRKWSFPAVGGHPMDHRFRHTDGDGDVLLVAAGKPKSGRVTIYQRGKYRDRDGLWHADIREYPHSIERARGTGVVVVAARSYGAGGGSARGGKLYVFRPTNKHCSSLVPAQAPIPFHQAHGVLWDPQLERMWAIGGEWLVSYRIVTTRNSAKLVQDRAQKFLKRGHDVQPDYDHPGRLLLSDSRVGVYSYDKATGDKKLLHGHKDVKSYVHHRSGEQMWTAGTPSNPFGTNTVHFNVRAPHKQSRSGAIFYRARLDTVQYQ